MRIAFNPRQKITEIDDPQVLDWYLADFAEIPEVLMQLYGNVCELRVPGWQERLDEILGAFKAARLRELDDEVALMQSMREGALAAEAMAQQAKPIPPPPPSPPPPPPPPAAAPPPPAPPQTWRATAAVVRHATVEPNADRWIQEDWSTEQWAKYSPLALLGYCVGRNGMPIPRRHQFLTDFVSKAVLPVTLPAGYLAEWGATGSAQRVKRTYSHISFQSFLRKRRSDRDAYAEAIGDWEMDMEFLRKTFGGALSAYEWRQLDRHE